jgi:HEPN domain-containing protein
MRRSEARKFVKRAKGFYEDAKNDFINKRFDLAMFHLEQVAQFLIKAKLLEIYGDFPKIHDVRELLTLLGRKFKKEEIKKFLKENPEGISLLADAYVAARYYFREFSKEEAKKSFELIKKLAKVIGYGNF